MINGRRVIQLISFPLLTLGLLIGMATLRFPAGLEYPFADMLTGKILPTATLISIAGQQLSILMTMDTVFIVGFAASWFVFSKSSGLMGSGLGKAALGLVILAGVLDITENTLVWVAFEQFSAGITANEFFFFAWRFIQLLSYLFAFIGGLVMVLSIWETKGYLNMSTIIIGVASGLAVAGIFIPGIAIFQDVWYVVLLFVFASRIFRV